MAKNMKEHIYYVDKGGVVSQSNISNGNGNLFAPSGVESLGGSCSINREP